MLGDELDSPRGRIYLIKDMLENDRPADEKVVTHIDRCLSCLSCMTTCPSGVHYMHLVDHARAHIEKTYKRPFFNRLTRNVLAMAPFAILGIVFAQFVYSGLSPALFLAAVGAVPAVTGIVLAVRATTVATERCADACLLAVTAGVVVW